MSVPHPGPRPSDLVFPAAEARAALHAVEGLLDALARTDREHRDAAADACVGFEGDSRRAFDTRLAGCLDDLAGLRAALTADADALEQRIAHAEQLRAERSLAQQRWDAAYERHLAAEREEQRRRLLERS